MVLIRDKITRVQYREVIDLGSLYPVHVLNNQLNRRSCTCPWNFYRVV